jgi:TP901 family phage tail tape measure protein
MADQKLRFFLIGDAKQFNRALTSAEQKLKAFGSKMQSTGRSLTMMTAPLVAAGGAAIKMAASFDKSMTKIKTLVGLAGDEVDAVRGQVMQMAKDTGSSADEAADALFFITSAGLELDDAMGVLNASLKASAIGLGDVATVADSATSAMNAYGKEALNAEMATDVLTNTVRLGKLSSEELAGSIGQVIPIASNLGVQFHEVGATLAAMSRTGTNAATASMQLKNILISILKPSKEGAETLEAMGLSSQKLRQQIKDEGLLSVLTTLKGRFEENEDAQAKVFGSSRALMGVMDLLGKGFKDTERIFADMADSAGVTAEAYNELQNSAEFKLRKAMTEVKETFRETGAVLMEALLPAIVSAGKFIKQLFERFNNLSGSTQKFIGVATMIGAVLGPVLIVFGTLISALGTIAGALGTARVAMVAFNTTMKANPIIAVVSAVISLATALTAVGQAKKKAMMDDLANSYSKLSEDEAATELKKVSEELKKQKDILHGFSTAGEKYVAKKEIAVLEEKSKLLNDHLNQIRANAQTAREEAQELKDLQDSLTVTTTGGGGTGDSGPSQEDIAKATAQALLTTKKKQFEAEKAMTLKHYDELIKANEGNASLVAALEQSKNEKLKQINEDYYAEDKQKAEQHKLEKAALITAIEDASALSDAQRKQLEIQRTQKFYDDLIAKADEFNLATDALIAARDAKLKEQTDQYNEMTTEFTETQKLLGQGMEAVFQGIGVSIAESLGGAGSALSAFLSTFIQGAMTFIAASLGKSLGLGITAAGQTALKAGPMAAFVLPALIAGATAAVTGAFKKIPKFAKGGIVSTPTMGLMGEYPGARSNPEVIAPLDKLTGMLGNTGGSNVNVGGEFRIKGQDLVVALQRANRNRDRIK